jgi:hypothetical protein
MNKEALVTAVILLTVSFALACLSCLLPQGPTVWFCLVSVITLAGSIAETIRGIWGKYF